MEPVGFILEAGQHRLEDWLIYQRRWCMHHELTLNERQDMPLCFIIFFMTIGSLPKNFISFSSQMTYSSSVPT